MAVVAFARTKVKTSAMLPMLAGKISTLINAHAAVTVNAVSLAVYISTVARLTPTKTYATSIISLTKGVA
jgi:hypothetical protein